MTNLFRKVVLGLSLLMLLGGCRNSMEEISALQPAQLLLEEQASGVTVIYSNNARVEARLYAPEFVRAEQARPPYTDAPKGVRMEFYDSAQKVQTRVTAQYARWYELKGNVLLRNQVEVSNAKGEQLQTDELVWNQERELFFTEKPVRIHTATQTLQGTGLEANQNFTWYRILNLTGVVKVDKTAVPM